MALHAVSHRPEECALGRHRLFTTTENGQRVQKCEACPHTVVDIEGFPLDKTERELLQATVRLDLAHTALERVLSSGSLEQAKGHAHSYMRRVTDG